GLPPGMPNFALAPLKTPRGLAWAGQQMKFTSALRLEGVKQYVPPYRLRLEVDGKFVEDLTPPASAPGDGQAPFSFKLRLQEPGSHLVSVIMEPDLPSDMRGSGYKVRDVLPADNKQDLAVEVVRELPVLLVDGADMISPESATFFLEKALAGPADA